MLRDRGPGNAFVDVGFFKNLPDFLGNDTLYALEIDKLIERSEVH